MCTMEVLCGDVIWNWSLAYLILMSEWFLASIIKKNIQTSMTRQNNCWTAFWIMRSPLQTVIQSVLIPLLPSPIGRNRVLCEGI